MMYPYITLGDETMIAHSELRTDSKGNYIEVMFDKPLEAGGFKTARARLPEYIWLSNEGFSQSDLDFFKEFLEHNSHTLFKYAQCGGIQIA